MTGSNDEVVANIGKTNTPREVVNGQAVEALGIPDGPEHRLGLISCSAPGERTPFLSTCADITC